MRRRETIAAVEKLTRKSLGRMYATADEAKAICEADYAKSRG
jgi:hypothetical protein